MLEHGDADLPEVIGAANPTGHGPNPLNRNQAQRQQDANDRHDDQQLKEGKARAPWRGM
jgi:hypothetical protein